MDDNPTTVAIGGGTTTAMTCIADPIFPAGAVRDNAPAETGGGLAFAAAAGEATIRVESKEGGAMATLALGAADEPRTAAAGAATAIVAAAVARALVVTAGPAAGAAAESESPSGPPPGTVLLSGATGSGKLLRIAPASGWHSHRPW